MANIDNVQLPDGSSYNIVDNTSGFATQNYVDSAVSSITKTTIGLGNVDNTSDLNKPISTATQTALDTLDEDKADKTDIATIESGTTASRAYSVGELVYVSGTLYRVKTAIASGATFTVGTNIEAKKVSDVVKGLNDSYTTLNSEVNAITSQNTNNVIESISAGTIARKTCTNGVVNIMGISPAGSSVTLAKIKTAYKPPQTIGAQVYEAASSDVGKARVSVEATGNIYLTTSETLNYGVYYNITYTIG